MNKAVDVTRGELIECTHNANIAVVNSNKELLYYYGDPKKVIYARSSLKPIQALQVLRTQADKKYNIEEKEIAIMCASHSAEKFHLDTVREILKKADIPLEKLNCGTHVPGNSNVYKEIVERREKLEEVHSNCSGKHSGMLISAKNLDEDLDTYLDINHPLQQRILDDIANICEYDKDKILIGIDGCGAPVHALPIENIAYGFSKMADSSTLDEDKVFADKITSCMTKHPEMVGGTNRVCTDLMRICKGKLFAKAGAQGVYIIGHKESKLGICIKVEDGSPKATACVAISVLKQLNLINEREIEELNEYLNPKLLNTRGDIIGEMVANFELIKN